MFTRRFYGYLWSSTWPLHPEQRLDMDIIYAISIQMHKFHGCTGTGQPILFILQVRQQQWDRMERRLRSWQRRISYKFVEVVSGGYEEIVSSDLRWVASF